MANGQSRAVGRTKKRKENPCRPRRMTGVGKRLLKARQKAGMSTMTLGNLSGVSHAVITQIETGHVKNPGVSTIQKIAKALGVDSAHLAFGTAAK